ncbi:hypothetical protein B879_00733 [Cecembia lonarensis LW9]|uniref:Uncharacterized protein n=1 Tax=Cecembia lonarensis (strain CCUG 58316 / KCTC 22772 / LW9) TaxID=1225176 RepID=K1LKC0_CECL9|nr:hypothetical protein B879_00733 [Cecembia lonarensis LW9]
MGKCKIGNLKDVKKVSGIAPLQPPTLASFRTWGIQQELVVPLVTKVRQNYLVAKLLVKIPLILG